jgi:hypothetical protein
MMETIKVNGGLALAEVERVARGHGAVRVELDDAARPRIRAARELVDRIVSEGQVVYGITTGFGALSEVVIPPDRLLELQANLIRSHAAGVGDALDEAETRAIMLLRANVLALGHSGVREVVIELLLACLNAGVHPVIPERGSVGASGDLAPLSHLALVLLGEGEAVFRGERMGGAAALERAGLSPLVLQAKEGLALNNGTQVHTGIGVLALLRAERALETLEVAGAMSLEGLRGTPDAFDPLIHGARPQRGSRRVLPGCVRCWPTRRSGNPIVTAIPGCRTPTRCAACRRSTARPGRQSGLCGRCWKSRRTARRTTRSSSPIRAASSAAAISTASRPHRRWTCWPSPALTWAPSPNGAWPAWWTHRCPACPHS